MSPGNTVTVVGNVTRDPEMRFTPGGQANVRLGIAVNRRWQDRASGEWKENVSFFNVVIWGEMAENANNSLKKGARVIVTGRLEQQSWEKDGQKHSVVEIIADEIAPSLRWATATVEKIERKGPGEAGGGGYASGSGGGRPVENAPPAAGYDDFGDEPF